MTDTAVIIVNYNGRHFLGPCLSSLQRQSYRNFMTVVVDNNSSDGSVEYLRKKFPDVHVIRLAWNCGFSAGNNAAFRMLMNKKSVKNFIILNNDTWVERNFVMALVTAAKRNRKTGSVACRIIKARREVIDSAGIGIRRDCMTYAIGNGSPLSEFNQRCSVFGAHGTAALYKRDMLEDVGLFDEDYSSYSEESDLSWRAFGRGWQCVYEPDAVVHHEGSGSWRKSPKKAKYLLERNGMWTIIKNLDRRLFAYCLPHIVAYQFLSMLFYIPRGDALTVAKARATALLHFPGRKRSEIQESSRIAPEKLKNIMTSMNYRKYLI